jgi:hypothetical protein
MTKTINFVGWFWFKCKGKGDRVVRRPVNTITMTCAIKTMGDRKNAKSRN